ncbi:MAG TPA: M23 family metallopeptidase [Longimicrobium sp.]|nr:M23 family metallopeptidase [Longimicrobium sp.]
MKTPVAMRMYPRVIGMLVALLLWNVLPASAHFYWPIGGTITRGPGSQGHTYNAGDIAGPNGYKVGTSNEGWYHAKLWDADGYGNYAMVRHRNVCGGTAFYTLYAHLSSFSTYAIGTWMTWKAPDGTEADGMMTVGYEGSTGRSTGPHVHFEIRQGSTKLWYVAPQYSTVNKNTSISGSDYSCAVHG